LEEEERSVIITITAITTIITEVVLPCWSLMEERVPTIDACTNYQYDSYMVNLELVIRLDAQLQFYALRRMNNTSSTTNSNVVNNIIHDTQDTMVSNMFACADELALFE